MHAPGGVPSAHVDPFVRSRLPPRALWPELDYSAAHLRHYPDRLNACAALLDAAVEAGAGGRPALHYEGVTWTFGHLLDRVQRIARVLVQDFGLVPGERVLLRSGNTPMVAACWLAVARAGGVVVNTMPLLRARELAYIAGKAQVRMALCELSLAEELLPVGLRDVAFFTPAGDGDADLDRRLAGKPPGGECVATAADDPLLVSFTSGTTGHPKAAVHFHRDVLAVTECWPQVYTLEPGDVVLSSSTLAFTYGLAASLLFPLRWRVPAALVYRPTPEAILEAAERHRVTSLYSVPTLYQSMLGHVADYDLSSLRKCASAGEDLRAPLWAQWREATGIRIVNGLGTTEMLAHFVSESMAVACAGSMGRAVPGYRVAVLDDEGHPQGAGGRGRLAVQGPTGCRYLDDPERQRSYVANGWNLTGDVCERDAEGCFRYVDRADDMIVSAGYNISPQEVEHAVAGHPKVGECAVVGVPSEARGNVVRACVVLRDPRDATPRTAREIQEFVKATLAPYKYPREVRFVDELPRTGTGKIQRFRLKGELQ